jgi:sugar porter (SP) family MFS transporter
MVASGILLAYLVSYALSPLHAWRWMIAVALVPALVLVVGVWVLPESPRWLLTRGRVDEARVELSRQVDPDEVEQAMAEMQTTLKRARPSWRSALQPGVRRIVLVAIGLSILAPLQGVNAIVYYAPTILRAIGFSDKVSLLNTIGFGIVSLIFTVVATRVIDRWGRRPLLITGALVMGASMTVMALLSWTTGLTVGVSGILAIACITVFKATFSLSWGTVTRVAASEILPLGVRGSALGVAEIGNFAATFTLTLVFPILLSAGRGTAFIVFGVMGLVACLFVAAQVPETQGRTLEEIEVDVRGG